MYAVQTNGNEKLTQGYIEYVNIYPSREAPHREICAAAARRAADHDMNRG